MVSITLAKAMALVRSTSRAGWIVAVPFLIYMGSLWTVRPVALSLVTPALFLLLPLTVKLSRGAVWRGLRGLRIELVLVAVMAALSFLSISNSNAPVRSARIIFPCLLPFMLVIGCVAAHQRNANLPQWIGRGLVAGMVVFCLLPMAAVTAVPSLAGVFFESYRFRALFENPIQCAIAMGTIMPILVAETELARGRLVKFAWAGLLLACFYTLFRTGSKFPLGMSVVTGGATFFLLQIRRLSLGRATLILASILGSGVFLATFGLGIADRIDPEIGSRLRQISGSGVSNYHSIQSRKLLWQEAIDQGTRHWLVGSGAGEKVLGLSHAHNLVLDYFKGIGLFGAAAVALLCLAIGWRCLRKVVSIFRLPENEADRRVCVFYISAIGYVVCSQLSDSFGPSTIGFLWLIYVVGVVSDRETGSSVRVRQRQHPLSPAIASPGARSGLPNDREPTAGATDSGLTCG